MATATSSADCFEIQTVGSAFAGRIPEHLWQTVNRATTPRGAYRHFVRWQRWYTPQPGSWSGHVRVLRNGRPVVIEPHYFDVHELDA